MKDNITLKFLAHEESISEQIPLYLLKCRLCYSEFEPINITDYAFIKSKLQLKSNVLEIFKIKFPDSNLETIFSNILGITRPKKPFRDKAFRRNPHLHICFEINGTRAYLDCEQISNKTKTILRGIDIGEV